MICPYCQKDFTIKKSRKKYCSRSCVFNHMQERKKGVILVDYNEDAFITDYNNNMRYVDMLEKHLLHPRTYYRIFNKLLNENKIKKRITPPLHTLAKHYKLELDESLIKNLYHNHTIAYIAKTLRVNRKTIDDRLKKYFESGELKIKTYKKIRD